MSLLSHLLLCFVPLLHLTGMDMISLEGKTNFFEKRVGEYGLANIKINKDDEDDIIDFNSVF